MGIASWGEQDEEALEVMRKAAVRMLREEQDRDLSDFGIHFDVYFLESSLYEDGRVESTIRRPPRDRQGLRSGRGGLASHHGVR